MKYLNILIVTITFLVSACASTETSFGPEFFSWGSPDKVRYVKISLTNSNSFAPSNTTTIILECRRLPKEIGDVMNDEDIESLKDSECRLAQPVSHDASVGIFPGFGSAVVNSAAVVGGAYFIGKGLEGSGDTTSLNNASESGSSSDSSSESDSQSDSSSESDSSSDSSSESESSSTNDQDIEIDIL